MWTCCMRDIEREIGRDGFNAVEEDDDDGAGSDQVVDRYLDGSYRRKLIGKHILVIHERSGEEIYSIHM